jgi:hypothetical protein
MVASAGPSLTPSEAVEYFGDDIPTAGFCTGVPLDISGRPMPRTIFECQVSKMVNSDTCPRLTTGACAPDAAFGSTK